MKNLSVAFGLTDIDMQNFVHRLDIINMMYVCLCIICGSDEKSNLMQQFIYYYK